MNFPSSAVKLPPCHELSFSRKSLPSVGEKNSAELEKLISKKYPYWLTCTDLGDCKSNAHFNLVKVHELLLLHTN